MATRESAAAEAAGTSDVKLGVLEERTKLLQLSLAEEEAKVASRDTMLRFDWFSLDTRPDPLESEVLDVLELGAGEG